MNIQYWLLNAINEIKNRNGNIRILNIQYLDGVISIFHEEQKRKLSEVEKIEEWGRIEKIVADISIEILDTKKGRLDIRKVEIDFEPDMLNEGIEAHSFIVLSHDTEPTEQEQREAQKLTELYDKAGERFQNGEGVPFLDGIERLYGVFTPSR